MSSGLQSSGDRDSPTRRLRLDGFPIHTDAFRTNLFQTAVTYGLVESIVFSERTEGSVVEIQFQRLSSASKMKAELDRQCAARLAASTSENAALTVASWTVGFVPAVVHVGDRVIVSSTRPLDIDELRNVAKQAKRVVGKLIDNISPVGATASTSRADLSLEAMMEPGGALAFLRQPTRRVLSCAIGRFIAVVEFASAHEANAFLAEFQAVLAGTKNQFLIHTGPKKSSLPHNSNTPRESGFDLNEALDMLLTMQVRQSLNAGEIIEGYTLKSVSNTTCIVDAGVVLNARKMRRILMQVETHFVRVEAGQRVEVRVGEGMANATKKEAPGSVGAKGAAAGLKPSPAAALDRPPASKALLAPPGAPAGGATGATAPMLFGHLHRLLSINGEPVTEGPVALGKALLSPASASASSRNASMVDLNKVYNANPFENYRTPVEMVPSIATMRSLDGLLPVPNPQSNFYGDSSRGREGAGAQRVRGGLMAAIQQQRGSSQPHGSGGGSDASSLLSIPALKRPSLFAAPPTEASKNVKAASKLFQALQARKEAATLATKRTGVLSSSSSTKEHFFYLPSGMRHFSHIAVTVERIGSDGVYARTIAPAVPRASADGEDGEGSKPTFTVFIPAAFVPRSASTVHSLDASGSYDQLDADDSWRSYAVEGESMTVCVLYAVAIGASTATMRIIASKRESEMRQPELQLPNGEQLIVLQKLQLQLQHIDGLRRSASATSNELSSADASHNSAAGGGGGLAGALAREGEVALRLKEMREMVEEGSRVLAKGIETNVPVGTIVSGHRVVLLKDSPCGPVYLIRPAPSAPGALFFLTAVCPTVASEAQSELHAGSSDTFVDKTLCNFVVDDINEYVAVLVEERVASIATGVKTASPSSGSGTTTTAKKGDQRRTTGSSTSIATPARTQRKEADDTQPAGKNAADAAAAAAAPTVDGGEDDYWNSPAEVDDSAHEKDPTEQTTGNSSEEQPNVSDGDTGEAENEMGVDAEQPMDDFTRILRSQFSGERRSRPTEGTTEGSSDQSASKAARRED